MAANPPKTGSRSKTTWKKRKNNIKRQNIKLETFSKNKCIKPFCSKIKPAKKYK